MECILPYCSNKPSPSQTISSPVETLSGVETAGRIEQVLLQNSCNGFPVLDQVTGQYVGFIRR